MIITASKFLVILFCLKPTSNISAGVRIIRATLMAEPKRKALLAVNLKVQGKRTFLNLSLKSIYKTQLS